MKMKHSYSVEKNADLYLAALFKIKDKYSVKNRQLIYEPEPHLDTFLESLNIFYDYEMLVNILDLLEKNNLVTRFTDSKRPIWGSKGEVIIADKYIDCVQLTNEGRRFFEAGQVLDKTGQAERAAERKKTGERLITAGISFGTAVLTMLVKWFIFDRK